jgi:hypothetical protein
MTLQNMETPIVTLTTDWGDRDYFASMVKGLLTSRVPALRIVDLSHSQLWNDILRTVYIVRYGCLSFPQGTVHVIDVGYDECAIDEDDRSVVQKSVLAVYRGHYFICSNRQILENAFEEQCDAVVELPMPTGGVAATFLAVQQYCGIVAALFEGISIEQLGTPTNPVVHRNYALAYCYDDVIEAAVMNIDSYGNANLNISYSEFRDFAAGRRFRIDLILRRDGRDANGRGERLVSITGISRHYSDVRMGELLLTVSATGNLQLAINKGSAARLVGLGVNSRCRFVFT